LLAFGPIVCHLGDDSIVFRSRVQGSVSCPFSTFIGRGSFSVYPQCSFASLLMPPRKRMNCRRGGGGNIGHKSVRLFAYDSFTSFFDVMPLEMRKKILLLDIKETRDQSSHLDLELVGGG